MLQTYFLDRFADLGSRLKNAERLPAWRRWWIFRDVHRALGFKFWALISGGATLPEHIEQFWSRLGLVLVQGYGMTETTALVSLNHPFHPARGSIGKVLPGREIRLGDDGEILVRGETVSNATWEGGRLQASRSDWLATGDLATVDEGGNLKFRGRKKEVIVTASGLNIYPDDLEAALLRQPQIRAAVVIEAAGPNGGEPLAALVMHGSADPAAAVRAANLELAAYQQIRRWTIWPDPDFPRTSTGKILRREVAAALRSTARDIPVGMPGGGMLATLIGRITRENIDQLPDSAALSEDLHLDSLGRVELQSVLEAELGIRLDAAAYQQVHTAGELRELLDRSTSAGTAPACAGTELRPASHDRYSYPVWPWGLFPHALRILFIEMMMRPLVALIGKPRVRRDAGERLSGPTLIVSNHVTAFDVPLILYALPSELRRRVAVAMAGEMLLDLRNARSQGNFFFDLSGPLQYLLATGLFNVFPLPQSGDFRKSFAHAGRAMDAGYHVLVFPEGRRTPDGLMHSFQGGAGLLWTELRSQALPIYLGGFRSGRVSIRIGRPIPFRADLEAAEATRVLERAVGQLGDDEFPATSQPGLSGI
jgi:long-chain acyl-CoA synthetase